MRPTYPAIKTTEPVKPLKEEAMLLGGGRLHADERRRRFQTGACLDSGQMGHRVALRDLRANSTSIPSLETLSWT